MSSWRADAGPFDLTIPRDISARLGATLRSLGRFAGSLGILTMQRVVQRAAGLISLYFVVRHLSPADLGQYQFVTVVIATAAFLALPGLDNALMQSIARGSRGLYRRATVRRQHQ